MHLRIIGLIKPVRLRWNVIEDLELARQFKAKGKSSPISITGRSSKAIGCRRRRIKLFLRIIWTAEQTAELIKQFAETKGDRARISIAGRSPQQIDTKLRDLGLIKSERKRCAWNRRSTALLKAKLKAGEDPKTIAIAGYTAAQVRSKIFRLGISVGPNEKWWSEEELKSLRSQWAQTGDPARITISGRSAATIRQKLIELELLEPTRSYWKAEELTALEAGWKTFGDAHKIHIPGKSVQQILLKLNALGCCSVPRWTKSQIKLLTAKWQRFHDPKKIIIRGRTAGAIRAKLLAMNVDLRNGEKPAWTEPEIASLRRDWQKCQDPAMIKIAGRSARAIKSKLIRLKLLSPVKPSRKRWELDEQIAVLERVVAGDSVQQIAESKVVERDAWGIVKWVGRMRRKQLLIPEQLEKLRAERTEGRKQPLDLKPLADLETELVRTLPKLGHGRNDAPEGEIAPVAELRKTLAPLSPPELISIGTSLAFLFRRDSISPLIRQAELQLMRGSTALSETVAALEQAAADDLLPYSRSARGRLIERIIACAYIPQRIAAAD